MQDIYVLIFKSQIFMSNNSLPHLNTILIYVHKTIWHSKPILLLHSSNCYCSSV